MIAHISAFIVASFLLAIAPGPDNIYVLTQSLVNGSKSGLATAAGLVSGIVIHTTLLAFGVSAIIANSPKLFYSIKVVGALYLLYLAYVTYNEKSEISLKEKAPKKKYVALYKQGFIMNLINPKVVLFFLGFFPGFLWNEKEDTITQFYILGIVFIIVAFITFATLSLLAGNISKYLMTHKSTAIILKWMQIVVFIGIALFIILP